MDEKIQELDLDEEMAKWLIAAFVPEADTMTYQEALKLALERNLQAAKDLVNSLHECECEEVTQQPKNKASKKLANVYVPVMPECWVNDTVNVS